MRVAGRRWRWPWKVAAALVLTCLALLALAWWFPARWAWQLVQSDYPAVHIERVSGSVWHGQADGLTAGGQTLGTLRWTLGRAAVFGHVHFAFDLVGAGVMANGHIARTADGATVIRDAHFQVSMTRLRAAWPSDVQLAGTLQGDVVNARLVEGWPTRLDARVRWQDAAVVQAHGRAVVLGDLLSQWQAVGGTVLKADVRDSGTGPLRVRGAFTATVLGWRLQARLTPRGHHAPLQDWLRKVGQPAAEGGFDVERSGGLMTERLQ